MATKSKPLGATLGEMAANRKGERETFGRALCRLMKDRGVSRHDVAQRCGVIEGVVLKWEQDQEAPTRGEFQCACRVLKQLRFYSPPEFLTQKQVSQKIAEIAPFAELDDWGPLNVERQETKEREVDTRHTEERVSTVRQIAHTYLDDAATPEERQRRLLTLQAELPRGQRKFLRIPSPDAMPPIRPPPKGAKRTLKCPRCQVEVDDLRSHRDRCTNRSERSWESAGWRTCEKSRHPHHWNVKGEGLNGMYGSALVPNPPAGMVLRSEPCESHRSAREAPRSPAPVKDTSASALDRQVEVEGTASTVRITPPSAPDSEAPPLGSSERVTWELEAYAKKRDGLELAERCLVLADMLWPTEAHHLVIWFAFGVWNVTVENTTDEGRAVRSGGTATGKREAVQALADALRAETKARARAAEDMARLLED